MYVCHVCMMYVCMYVCHVCMSVTPYTIALIGINGISIAARRRRRRGGSGEDSAKNRKELQEDCINDKCSEISSLYFL